MSGLRRMVDRLLGRGSAAVTVPTLDGPLLPNQTLEEGASVLARPEVDNLVVRHGEVVLSSGAELRAFDPGRSGTDRLLRTFGGPITALAAAADQTLAIAVEGEGLLLSGDAGDRAIDIRGDGPAGCVTALAWIAPTTLAVAIGATGRRAADWRRDLMEQGCTGSVWRLDVITGTVTCLARNLAWPSGLVLGAGGRLFVAEGWRHRILDLDTAAAKPPRAALVDLPAYPGRITAAAGGGFWLACPTIRNQLVEFILREPGYCRRMLAEVPEPFWMAPTLASGLSFKEPMQGSALKQMGILKPWSATRSYGLVIRCDAAMQPLFSFQSRADGRVHGVTSVAEWGGALLVGARGAGDIVSLPGVCADAVREVAA